jgi:hypothetical protein
MAPAVTLRSYDWNSDTAELLTVGATTDVPGSSVLLTNHSYGYIAGWEYDGSYWWYGRRGDREDESFGQYDSDARSWDDLASKVPYTLIFKSAGNDRSDNAPPSGTTFYYASDGSSKSYNASTDPYSDGYNSGFDTIGAGSGSAKNLMTVGAANDAVQGGLRNPASSTISSFSGFGPTDDGRIKPDIVANGVNVYSSLASSNTAYGSYSGTSMSSPNACGSAMLLQELYSRRFGGRIMRADLLKALIIHTADDIGAAGPDYQYGWGLMNVQAAANLVVGHATNPVANTLAYGAISNTTTTANYTFEWNGSGPLRVTLCWIDPPGTVRTGLDNTARSLVNDLDIRLTRSGGSTHLPYTLNGASPASLAVAGDNVLDNVEHIFVQSPGTGLYTLTVSKKGTLTGATQNYALVISGHRPGNSPGIGVSQTSIIASNVTGTDAVAQTMTVRNSGTGTLNYALSDDASWLSLSPASGTSTGEADTINLTFATASLVPGIYNASITVSGTGLSSVIIPVNLTVNYAGAISLTQGIDVGTTPAGHGVLPWSGVATPARDGVDAGRSGAITHSQESGFTLSFSGPGTVSFWWKVDSEASQDFLDVDVNGVTQQSISGNVDWAAVNLNIPAGASTIRWKYRKNASVSVGADAGWVDQVSFQVTSTFLNVTPNVLAASAPSGTNAVSQTFSVQNQGSGSMDYTITDNVAWLSVSPASGTSSGETDAINVNYSTSALAVGTYTGVITVTAAGGATSTVNVTLNVTASGGGSGTLPDAVDTPGRTWTTSGSGVWFRQTAFNYDGVDAAQSGSIGNSQSCSMSSTFTGPSNLTFRWRVSSESGYDYLQLRVNGAVVGQISGSTSWALVTQPLGAGSNTVEFRYVKDGSVVAGQDAGWVDTVAVTTASSELNDALDIYTLGFADFGWGRTTTTSYTSDGVDAAVSDPTGDGQESYFQFTITGPARLSYRWRVSCERDYDFLSLYVNGNYIRSITGSVSYNTVTQDFPAGDHTVEIVYSKDSSIASGLDRGFVDTMSVGVLGPPPAPGGLSASDGSSNTSIHLSWTAVSGATSYNVYRHTSNAPGSATVIATNVTEAAYADATAAPGTIYNYWVAAVGIGGTGAFSATETGYRGGASNTITNGSLIVQIRPDNGAIDTVQFNGGDFFKQGTAVLDFGLQAGANTSTFRVNTTNGATGMPVTVNGTIVSGVFSGGAAPVAFYRVYSLVPGQNVLRVSTTLTNQGGAPVALRYFETADPDHGVSVGHGYEAGLSIVNVGGLPGAQATVPGGLTCILHSNAGPPAVTLAAGSPFQIDSGDTLNAVVTTPFDAAGASLDQGMHLVHSPTVSPGQPVTLVSYISIGTSIASAQSGMAAAVQPPPPQSLVPMGNVEVQDSNGFTWFKGADNKLWVNWWGGSSFLSAALTDANCAGDITIDHTRNYIWYRGTDSKLYVCWFGGGKWNHAALTDANCAGDISINRPSGFVWYRGTDSMLYVCWFGGGKWNHVPLTGPNCAGDVGVDVKTNYTWYRGTDGRVYVCWWGGSAWLNGSFTPNNCAGDVNVDSDRGYIWYRGTDSIPYALWFEGGRWNFLPAAPPNCASDFSVDPRYGHSWYRGIDNRLYLIWKGSGVWNHIGVTGATCAGGIKINEVNGQVWFKTTDGNLGVCWWGGSSWLSGAVAGSQCDSHLDLNSPSNFILYRDTAGALRISWAGPTAYVSAPMAGAAVAP